ncbi:hypothetical protein [Kribbella qitaiheensis]|uniref:hypothetical protein n=1 Tax=Kribbella qitaiheensis TaxID=1544730 RepID=UPI001FEC5DFE|nr:hypothetical protein [Kribbella qitaiheensis]
MVGPGAPTIPQLVDLGVTRFTIGPAITTGAYGLAAGAAEELLTHGTYTLLKAAVGYGTHNNLLH